jgi:transposase-like protein
VATGRRIEDEGEAQRCLLAAKRSGQNAGEWARAHGVDGRSLNAWRMNLGRRGAAGSARPRQSKTTPKTALKARTLVELVPSTCRVDVAGVGRYVLEVDGARVEFGDDVSVTTLRRVLEVLRPC